MQTAIFLIFMLLCRPLLADNIIEVIPLKNRPASELQAIIAPLLDENDRIIADGNQLILKTDSQHLASLQRLIHKLDKPLANLTITVIQSNTLSAHDLNQSANIHINLPDKSYLRGHYGNTQSINNHKSRQIIRTVSGKPAIIKFGKSYPIYNISLWNYGNNQSAYSLNTDWIETTTGFIVIPRLSGNQVTLDIAPWSDRKNNNNIDTQSASTTLQTRLGQWTELGAINQNGQSQTQGLLKHSRNTQQKTLKILVKVDKIQ